MDTSIYFLLCMRLFPTVYEYSWSTSESSESFVPVGLAGNPSPQLGVPRWIGRYGVWRSDLRIRHRLVPLLNREAAWKSNDNIIDVCIVDSVDSKTRVKMGM